MRYLGGIDRNQIVFFPDRLDDYISEDNPVRVLDEYVAALDMKDLGFTKVVPADTGRPAYDPRDLLKLYLYGYLNRIRTSRKLETEAGRNLELMWLLRKLKPDFKTIADFRKDNKKAIKEVFKHFTLLCKQWGLFGEELVAVDSSKFRASNSKRNNFNEKKLDKHIKYIDDKIEDYMKALEKNDAKEKIASKMTAEEIKTRITELEKRKTVYEGYKTELQETGNNEKSLTDPDSRLMSTSNNSVEVCYNVQTVVDSKHSLIADCDVTNDPHDYGQLSEMGKKAKKIFKVKRIKVLADKGYYCTDDLKECEKARILAYVAKPVVANSTGEREFYSDKFKYDKKENVYICPANQKLYPSRERLKEKVKTRDYKNFRACRGCEFRNKCTTSKKGGRIISRKLDQEILNRVDKRTKKNKELYKKRQMIAEHPFGTTKRGFGFHYFLTRGLESVKTEARLTFFAYNLKRVINILGVKEIRQRLALVM